MDHKNGMAMVTSGGVEHWTHEKVRAISRLTSMSQSLRNWLISCDSVQKCGDTVRSVGKIGYHFLHGENNLWIKYFTIIFTEHPMGRFRHIPGSLPPESNSGFVDLISTCPWDKMVVLLSLVGLCNIFGEKNAMNKNTPMIFDDRQVLLELDPTFSWDSANSTYDARHGIVTPLWYVAMQPGGLTSDVGRWVEIRIKKSLGLFFWEGF